MSKKPIEEEGLICDECGCRVGPMGCCATIRWLAAEELETGGAALALRKARDLASDALQLIWFAARGMKSHWAMQALETLGHAEVKRALEVLGRPLAPNVTRCNCERIACDHGERACERPAGRGTIEHLGSVCDACWRAMPEQYRKRSP